MALETQTILKSIYRALLLAETIEEGQAAVRDIMDERDAVYVEKNVEKMLEGKNKKE